MKLTRRVFLKVGALGAAVVAGGSFGWQWLRGRSIPQLDDEHISLLRAVVDVLVPADQLSPGALDLGIDRDLIENSRDDDRLRRLLFNGGAELQQAARRAGAASFPELPPASKVELLREAEAASRETPQRRLFDRLREETLARYYARPESWGALCYQGPPQPLGFMDYAEAPRRCT